MRRYHSNFKPRSIRRLERKNKRNIVITTLLAIFLLYFVFSWGLPSLIGGLSIFNRLKPVEKGQTVESFSVAPPVLNIPFEATNSASIKISGYSLPNSKVEIYFDDELKTTANTKDDGSFLTDRIDLALGTNNIYGKTISSDNNKSLSSKTIKLIYSNEKPKLDVSEPADGQEIKGGDKKIKVSGITDSLNTITINGQTVIVSSDGGFSSEVQLNEGDNAITIISSNPTGSTTKIQRGVKYTP